MADSATTSGRLKGEHRVAASAFALPIGSSGSSSERQRSVGVEVFAHLEKLIVTGHLRPGDRLPSERDLATRLGVSRASLRDAMHELEARHLVERRPGRGTTVLPAPERVQALYARITDEEHQLRDVAELRETIEPRLAALAAARATEADLIALEEVLRRGVTEVSPVESLQLDVEFHMLIAHASQNPLMSSINTLVCSWTSETRLLSHSTRYAREISYLGHRAILEAVTQGDPDAARDAMTRHLTKVAELTRASFTRNHNGRPQ